MLDTVSDLVRDVTAGAHRVNAVNAGGVDIAILLPDGTVGTVEQVVQFPNDATIYLLTKQET